MIFRLNDYSSFKTVTISIDFSNANILYTQLDRLVLGVYVGKEEVAYYVMAFQIMMIINTLMLSVVQVTVPRLSYLSGMHLKWSMNLY